MTSSRLLIVGLGYTGLAVACLALGEGFEVAATTRSPHPRRVPGVRMLPFGAAGAEIAAATHLFSTAPPPGDGAKGVGVDPVLDAYGAAIAAAPALRWAGYCSSTAVYGHHGGGWVDETTEPAPTQERGRRRLAAERAWASLSGRIAVDLLRIAGIYGPGHSVLDDLRDGRGRRIVRPGQMFSRIHRDDIARATLAAVRQERAPCVRVLNLADDEPAESAAVAEEAARLLGVDPPPAVPYAEIESSLGPMARSFWQENRRVSSAATKAALGITWHYPSYREGLRAILATEIEDSATD